MDEIVLNLRRRLLAGKTMRPPSGPRLPPAFLRRQLHAWQLRKFRRTMDYAATHVPFYGEQFRQAGINTSDIRSLADVRKLPFTRRDDLQTRQADFISRAPGQTASVYISSSGTTADPINLYLTPGEIDRYTSMQAIAGMTYGFLGPQHIAQVHIDFDRSVSPKIYNLAAFKSGTLVLTPGLAGGLDRHLDSLLQKREVPGKFSQVSILFGAPGFLWALAERSLERGLTPQDFGLRRVFATGAKVSEALKAKVKSAWGLRLFEGYSLGETLSTGAFECDHGHLHFLDFSGLLEVLQPDTLEPVAPGETGLGVITTFYPDRELMPVIRYWTNDLIRTAKEDTCPCGLVTRPIAEIVGRNDHMIVIGGHNIYPQPVGDVLLAFPELVRPPRFQIRVEERPGAQVGVIEAELAAPLPEAARQALAERILRASPLAHTSHAAAGVVKCEVELVPAGSIAQPFRYKLHGPTPL